AGPRGEPQDSRGGDGRYRPEVRGGRGRDVPYDLEPGQLRSCAGDRTEKGETGELSLIGVRCSVFGVRAALSGAARFALSVAGGREGIAMLIAVRFDARRAAHGWT